MTIGLRTSWLQYPVETFTSPYKITSQRRDSVDDSTFGTLNDSTLPPARQSLIRPHSSAEPMAPFRRASSAPSPPGEGTLPSNVPQPTRFHKHQAFSTQGEGRPRSGGDSQGSRKCKVNYFTFSSFSFIISLTFLMPKGRGFLVRRPMRRLRRIGVLHDLPKREFPCAPRYVLFPFMQLWICLPKLCAGCSLRHSHLCRDGFRMLGNPIRGRSNPLSVDSDSRRRSKSDSTGRRYRL